MKLFSSSLLSDKKSRMVSELQNLFDDMIGPVVLHWSGSDQDPIEYQDLNSALQDVAEEALDNNQTAKEIERIAYIVTLGEYKDEQREQAGK